MSQVMSHDRPDIIVTIDFGTSYTGKSMQLIVASGKRLTSTHRRRLGKATAKRRVAEPYSDFEQLAWRFQQE